MNNSDLSELPVLYGEKKECFGCSACYSICPQSAIDMKEDDEGFLYPEIFPEKCSKCNLCLNVCPLKGKIDNNATQ